MGQADWDWWRTFAAVWGAVLSTVLAFLRLLPEPPLLNLEPYDRSSPEWIRLRVINLSKRPLVIEGHRQIRFRGNRAPLGLVLDAALDPQQASEEFYARMGRRAQYPRFYVRPESGFPLLVSQVHKNTDRVLILCWHRNWLIPVKLPAFIRVSRKTVEQINDT